MKNFLVDFWLEHNEWLVLLIIPISAAVVGWFTNRLALRMTFYPIEFRGIQFSKKIWWLRVGWQGIIPSKASKMAALSSDLILNHLIDTKEIFSKLDPARVAEELEPGLKILAKDTFEQAMKEHVPLLWSGFPKRRKENIFQSGMDALPATIEALMEDMKNELLDSWDVKAMIIKRIENNREILNELFLRCGEQEFKFIEKSGFYFGFVFGLMQMVLWYFIQDYSWAWVTLPIFGLIIGYLTNFIALRLIFKPQNPIKVGPITFHGLFIKRQKEIAGEFGKVLSSRLFTMASMYSNIIEGSAMNKLVALFELHLNDTVDKTAGLNRSLIQITAGTKTYNNIKSMVVKTFIEGLPNSLVEIFDYAETALDIEATVSEKMANLSPEEFVSFMRPIFQEDEWKLILIGSLLGMGAGFLQLLFLI